MHMLLRMLILFLKKRSLKKSQFGETTEFSMRVLPVDLDILMHVNNGMYFSYMDFGRYNMIFRNGAYDLSRQKGWYSVVAGETIKFKRSLQLWQKFTIKTQIIGNDERYFYIRQTFVSQGKVMAIGMVKIRFLKKTGGTLSTTEVLAEMGGQSLGDARELSREWMGIESKYLIEA